MIKGFFLRDLKFDNIMIDSNKNVMLIDFDQTKECSDDTKKLNQLDLSIFHHQNNAKIINILLNQIFFHLE